MESGKNHTKSAHVIKKVIKPLLQLLHRRLCQRKLRAPAREYVPVTDVPVWTADLSAEIGENSVNEALEARLKELIAASPHAEICGGQLQVKVSGTLTLRPARRVRFEEDFCHRTASCVTSRQRAQAQAQAQRPPARLV